jgi:hypothetical protein
VVAGDLLCLLVDRERLSIGIKTGVVLDSGMEFGTLGGGSCGFV